MGKGQKKKGQKNKQKNKQENKQILVQSSSSRPLDLPLQPSSSELQLSSSRPLDLPPQPSSSELQLSSSLPLNLPPQPSSSDGGDSNCEKKSFAELLGGGTLPPPVLYEFVEEITVKATVSSGQYDCGTCLFGMQQHDGLDVSIKQVGSKDEADELFKNLSVCANPYIIGAHFVNGQRVIIDRVQEHLSAWVSRVHNEFRRKKYPTQQWWRHIESEFKKIFRNINMALAYIHKLGFVCGRLIDATSLTANNGVKLTHVSKPKPTDFQFESAKDLTDLRTLMIAVLTWPNVLKEVQESGIKYIEGIDGSLLESNLNQVNTPADVKCMIEELADPDALHHIPSQWILDDSALWVSADKYKLIRKLREGKIDKQYLDEWLVECLEERGIGLWSDAIPPNTRAYEIYERTRNDYVNYYGGSEQKRKSNASLFASNSSLFWKLVKYFRNYVEHFDKTMKQSTVIESVDNIFGLSICSMLRYAMSRYVYFDKLSLGNEYNQHFVHSDVSF